MGEGLTSGAGKGKLPLLYNPCPMNDDSLRRQLDELCRAINDHNYRYHVLDQPVVSDAEYDSLWPDLRAIEEKHPEGVPPDPPPKRPAAQPSAGSAKFAIRRPSLAS